MQTHIARWGNSLALRIPRSLADRLGARGGRCGGAVGGGRSSRGALQPAASAARRAAGPHHAREPARRLRRSGPGRGGAVGGGTRPGRSGLARLRAPGRPRAGRAAPGAGALPARLSPAHARTRSSARSRAASKATHSRCRCRTVCRSPARCSPTRSRASTATPAGSRSPAARPTTWWRRSRSGSGRCWKVDAMRDQAVDATFTIFGHSAGAWNRCRVRSGAQSGSEGRTAAGIWVRAAGLVVTRSRSAWPSIGRQGDRETVAARGRRWRPGTRDQSRHRPEAVWTIAPARQRLAPGRCLSRAAAARRRPGPGGPAVQHGSRGRWRDRDDRAAGWPREWRWRAGRGARPRRGGRCPGRARRGC